MEFLNLNKSVQNAVRIAKGIAREYSNPHYMPAHMLYALMHKEINIESFVSSLGQDSSFIREWAEVRIEDSPKASPGGDITAHERMADVFEKADNIRLQWGLLEINPICVFTALIVPEVGFSADELKSFPIRERDIHDLFLGGSPMQSTMAAHVEDATGGEMPLPKTNLLKYCTNKTEAAAAGKVFPIVRRDNEIRMMMEILGRHNKPNVLIIGDAGVGKQPW